MKWAKNKMEQQREGERRGHAYTLVVRNQDNKVHDVDPER